MIANNKKDLSKILMGIFAVVLLLPSIGLAGLKLEQQYPAISGITGQSESLNNAVSQTQKNAPINTVSLIKYIFTLTSVFLIGLSTLAVIIAGVQYLSSTGKVVAQKEARKRVLRSFLGLAIVIGASLILQIIAPGLSIPQLTHINDSTSNVILISKLGMDDLEKNAENITKEFLNKLEDDGKIKYFASQSANLEFLFGGLTNASNPISFSEFQPAYIGFSGNGRNNIRVKTFSGKNFLGEGHSYSVTDGLQKNDNTGGKIDNGIEVGGINGGINIMYFTLQIYYATAKNQNNIYYLDVATQKQTPSTDSLKYPPLSMTVEGVSAGVYLYGSTEPIVPEKDQQIGEGEGPFGGVWGSSGGTGGYYRPPPSQVQGNAPTPQGKSIGGGGGQRYLQFDVPNFADNSFNFDNEAFQVEIKNNRQLTDTASQDDLLIFLFQNPYYKGPFRAFFEKKGSTRGGVDVVDLYIGSTKPKWFDDDASLDTVKRVYADPNKENEAYNWTKFYNIGNTIEDISDPSNNKTLINKMDQQGNVFGVSSARIFHLAPINGNNCEAVALCNGEDLSGFCLVFTPTGRTNNKWMSFFLPMPWFIAVPIPKDLPKNFDKYGDGDVKIDTMLAYPNQMESFEKEKDLRKFNDNIESIGIKGSCVVALYDNGVEDVQRCNSWINNGKDCWDNQTVGENSMVFSGGDMVSGTGEMGFKYLNLKKYQIHSCVSRLSALRLTKPHSCVSSVAVYPVK